jgi:prolyl 4-hydroxylase
MFLGGLQSECAADTPLHVHPKKGDAVLFFSLHVDGRLDPSSLHGGCPVVAGEKWSATKWMRVGTYKDA